MEAESSLLCLQEPAIFSYSEPDQSSNSTQQGSSREANRSSASQEIPHIVWDPKIRYRIHKRPPFVRTPSQINPIHAPIPLLEDPFQYHPPIYA